MIEVSAIIPTWNRAFDLEKAARSVLNQSISSIELLICDDGSTDDSKNLLSKITDNRLRWIDCTRSGRPAIPRNIGIRESRGEWLAFLDDDDEWLPDKLEKQLQAAKNAGCLAVCSNAVRFVPDKGMAGNYLTLEREQINFDDLLKVNEVICSTALVHKSLLENAIGFPEDEQLKALEDYALWLRIATMSTFAYIAEPLIVYKDQPTTSIRSNNISEWEQRRRVFANLLKWISDKRIQGFSYQARVNYYQAIYKCCKLWKKEKMRTIRQLLK